jgi:hypothetical protein
VRRWQLLAIVIFLPITNPKMVARNKNIFGMIESNQALIRDFPL